MKILKKFCFIVFFLFVGINSTARISMNFTTNKDDIDIFIDKLKETINFLKINS